MTDRRLPYHDSDDDAVLAHPCLVCGTMVATWNDPSHHTGKPVYCSEHKGGERKHPEWKKDQ